MSHKTQWFGDLEGPFSTFYIDPPWAENGGGKIQRGANRHYKTMNTKDILKAIKGSGLFNPGPRSHLWLWVTNNFLKDGIWLMEQLGFRYITNLVWVKDRIGLGQYMRQRTEILLFGSRGDPQVPEPGDRPPNVIEAPKTTHSTKPTEAYEVIERVSPGPYVEFFARQKREGWRSWGDEV